MTPPGGAARIAVVGGGVSGLAAAHRLRTLVGHACSVEVFEASERLGGKLRTVRLAGADLDVGAEAFLARRPEVPELLSELGLAEQVEHPSGSSPRLFSGGLLHPVPAGTLMGVPADPSALPALLGPAARTAGERDCAPLAWERGSDTSVGALVADRFGREVVSRCVDPLLGGVYSGSADTIGVRAALPGLAAALDDGAATLRAAIAAAQSASRASALRTGPVFGALRGGYGRLIEALASAGHARLRMCTPVRGVRRGPMGWSVSAGDRHGAHGDELFDAVILAVPAPAAAALLESAAPEAAAAAGSVPLADSAVVAVALPESARMPEISGVLVATDEQGLGAKACTLSTRKWPHLGGGAPGGGRDGGAAQLLRMSYGRYGASEVVGETDADLAGRARTDLRALLGVDAEPLGVHVQRWRGGLPQYGPHHDRIVAGVEAAVESVPGLAVAGSAWHGVGVPACIGGGRAAAGRIAEHVGG